MELSRLFIDARREVDAKDDEIVRLKQKIRESSSNARRDAVANKKEIKQLKKELMKASSEARRDLVAKDGRIQELNKMLRKSSSDMQRDMVAREGEIMQLRGEVQTTSSDLMDARRDRDAKNEVNAHLKEKLQNWEDENVATTQVCLCLMYRPRAVGLLSSAVVTVLIFMVA